MAELILPFTARLPERRIRKHRYAGLDAEITRGAGGLHCDVRQLFGIRHVMHGRVGDKHGAAAADGERDANHGAARPRVDGPAYILIDAGPIPRDAGDHDIGITVRDHQGREYVALVDDEAVAIALQVATPLQPLE